ncbi:MAG: hypothetical protein AB4063_24670 [Crocosphaera sp.]
MINPTLSWWEQTSVTYNSAVWKSSVSVKYHRIPSPLWLSFKEEGEGRQIPLPSVKNSLHRQESPLTSTDFGEG